MSFRRCRWWPVCVLALTSLLALAGSACAQTQKVVSLEVRGNVNISREAIMAAVTRTRIGADFSQQQLDEDVRSIRRLGWFYQVNPIVETGADGVKIIIGVVEHPKVTAIQITGNTKFTEAELLKLMSTQVGSVFNEVTFQRDVEAIERHYRANEYRLARVTEEVDITPEGVVKIPIAEGWVEEIRVEGLKKTKQYVVMRELDTKPGEVFYGKQLQEDLQRLRNLDYFETMEPQIADGSEPGKVKLVINVKEKKTGTVSVGLGYSSRDRLVGFADVTEHNFRGRGQQVGLRWEAGQFTNRSGYEFSFTDPWALGKRTSLGLRLYDAATN
ncbi:MAG: POTRA domain-containing protein, partial [Armatimonadota bacterium]|nr:POTRA domain-containing protein [Armatimonadota bacterium]